MWCGIRLVAGLAVPAGSARRATVCSPLILGCDASQMTICQRSALLPYFFSWMQKVFGVCEMCLETPPNVDVVPAPSRKYTKECDN
ncbi:hypothetical protein GDO78_013805 [Eleutherodactylus coqui]|uniref:Secreted protein n=1 Tax=Eleutherodactylus coqui TaxID=57060 RepID=A0A8J6B8H5_ELECQ|nr:hypothetical protein GDO78_013805 [Eleutherodactylus coqui]